MKQEQVIHEVAKEMGIISKEDTGSFNRQQLINIINDLAANDFDKLISILYRMDVSEVKLKSLLQKNTGTDAGVLIADLVIERQAQKIKSREQFSRRDTSIDEEDKW